jgi:GTP-binding protein
VIVAVNKWDLLTDKPTAKAEYSTHIRHQLKFLDYVPIEFISAKSGYKVKDLMDKVVEVFTQRSKRLSTSQLMDIVKTISIQHTPGKGKKKLKVKFATQAAGYPPTFTFFVNDTELVHFSFERYLENSIRLRYPFLGTPLRLIFRKNEGKERIPKKRK